MGNKLQSKIEMIVEVTKNSYRLTFEQATSLFNIAKAPYVTKNNPELNILVNYGLLQVDSYDMLSTTVYGDDIILEAADKLGYSGSQYGSNYIIELKDLLNIKNIIFVEKSKRRNTIIRLDAYHDNAFKYIEFRQDDILLSGSRKMCTNDDFYTGKIGNLTAFSPVISDKLCYTVSYGNFNKFMELVFNEK